MVHAPRKGTLEVNWDGKVYSTSNDAISKPSELTPPLDIAVMWLVHRLDPEAYAADCTARFGFTYHPDSQQAFEFTDGTVNNIFRTVSTHVISICGTSTCMRMRMRV